MAWFCAYLKTHYFSFLDTDVYVGFGATLNSWDRCFESNRACQTKSALLGGLEGLTERWALFLVRQAWRVARKRNQFGCGGHAGDLEVKVLYTPGKGKC